MLRFFNRSNAAAYPEKKRGLNVKKTSSISNALIWFGAGVSVAEILTGTLIAPLGLARGTAAILLGHFIGCVLLFLAGFIGGKTEKSAMETVEISFGKKGAKIFSALNVLQLAGWTAVMISSGAGACKTAVGGGGNAMWCFVIGALIAVWVLLGIRGLEKVNRFVSAALLVLCAVMIKTVFSGDGAFSGEGTLSFGAAVELSVAMPLSWLPLISDYTKSAEKPREASLASSVTYFFVSVCMYIIGLGAAVLTGESDIALILSKAGLGIWAVITVILSTVTTTFLDVYSAGVSAVSVSKRVKEKPAAIVICVLGTLLAAFTPAAEFESFLYIIGSVFAPMTAILITDYFILKRDSSTKKADYTNLAIWVLGFCIYRVMMNADTFVGYTLPAMLIIGAVCVIADRVRKAARK